MQAVVPYYGKVWCDNMAISNILSLTNLVNKYRVAYDSHQDDTFTIQTNIGIINFRRHKQGIYVFNTTYTIANSNGVTTVEYNMIGFTSRQTERAKLTIKIYINLGLPTVKKFKLMVSINMI